MSLSARNWAWDHLGWALNGVPVPFKEKLTLLCLAEHESAEYGYSFPSHERIADRTGQSTRTVQTHIRTLAERGAITVTKRKRQNGQYLRNVYYLDVPESYRENDPEWVRLQG
ncbi:hypothetical protein BH09ACT6_BH09ACT6_18720 [soil metagenome]